MAAYTSFEKLAKAVGVAKATMIGYVKRADFPAGVPRKKPAGGWSEAHVSVIRQWRGHLQEDRSGKAPANAALDALQRIDPAMKAQVDMLLKRERMLHEKLKREILEGTYIKRELVDGALGGLAALFVSVCDELEIALPARLEGKNQAQIEKELMVLLDMMRRRIAEKAEYELVHVSELSQRVSLRGRGRPRA